MRSPEAEKSAGLNIFLLISSKYNNADAFAL
jgi:hypothetical protein